MDTHQIRRAFLDYFVRHGHREMPSASLVPFDDDPSVLLTIAGMQPFKAYFMGTEAPPTPRLASCQKCFRTGDIDQIGYTARHLTFFEMLGNFSLGDYFKKEAIRFGWEMSTEVFGLDPERIWITVFEGMDGIPGDDEAVEYWIEAGVPAERIQRLGEEDNFWKAGPTGPCGPNTELYFDRGPDFGPDGGPAVGGDRFLEFWNLVFMQYERAEDGTLSDLPAKNIDTGAGLERVAALLQDTPSVFETDAFWPLIVWGQAEAGVTYGKMDRVDRALRVLADHGRAMTFLAADGVRPSNEGRGFVLRRIIRRAVSEANHLGLWPGVMVDLGGQVVDLWSDAYPNLQERRADIDDVLGTEAEQFARTLQAGRRMLSEVVERSASDGVVSGDDAFRLHDTYGFPLDLTVEAAADAGLSVDVDGFNALMTDQRSRSRARSVQTGETSLAVRAASLVRGKHTRFVGFDTVSTDARVIAAEELDDGGQLVCLDVSPFYAQGGGQISDTGRLSNDDGERRVVDVLRVGGDQVLRVEGAPLADGDTVYAEVDAAARSATQGHHTATHILHWALRDRLGTDVRQAGSYVGPDKLRFDVTHRGKIDPAVMDEVERMVNARIEEDAPVVWNEMPKPEADALGAIGMFGEKYGDVVRVVQAGDYSLELCGGTHVSRTSEIGAFKVIHEGSVGAGARRIEALSGPALTAHYAQRIAELERELEVRNARISALEDEVALARASTVDPGALVADATEHGTVRAVVAQVDAHDGDALLGIADQIKQRLGDGAVVVLGAVNGGKVLLLASLGAAAVDEGLSAGAIIKEIAPLVGGGGGGKPAMARAGGKDPDGLPAALDRARAVIADA